jgi:hypothetical protein
MIRTRLGQAVAAVVFALAFMGIGAGIAMAAQPHMVNARGYLYSALHELQAAVPDKGGYRNNAINSVNAAINQVNAGIHFAATH